jgi:hypothetical protein
MADEAGNNNVFVYMGGNQRVPRDVRYVRIHKSVKNISARAFRWCVNLVSVEMHDGVEIIEEGAFWGCSSLRGIKLTGVWSIGRRAFAGCGALETVEFGDKLDIIEESAFSNCTSLRTIKIPKVRVIGEGAFTGCEQLTDVELSEDVHRIEHSAFIRCRRLRRIAIPLKYNLLKYFVFDGCTNLSTVDLIGGVHKTISSLLLDSWRIDMSNEIDRINQVLPNTLANGKTNAIKQWIARVCGRMEQYKNMTLLELALWKANLPNVDAAASRDDARVTCGAAIIIPHVLPFLYDADEFPLLDCDLAALCINS